MANLNPFASLSRRGAKTKAAAAEDEDRKDDEESKASKKADDDEEDDQASSKAKTAEDDDESDKKDDKDDKDAKAKKADDDEDEDADESDGDDESDKKDEKDAKARAARGRERGRLRAIMTSDAGLANPVAAAHLATETSMPRKSAIAMLRAMGASAKALAPAPKSDKLRDRMDNEPQPKVGAGGTASGPDLVQSIVTAHRKAQGDT